MACIWFIELRTRTKVKWQQIVDQGLTSLHCNVILHCKHAVVSNTIVLIFSFGADSWLPSGDAVTFWPSVHPWCNQRLWKYLTVSCELQSSCWFYLTL